MNTDLYKLALNISSIYLVNFMKLTNSHHGKLKIITFIEDDQSNRRSIFREVSRKMRLGGCKKGKNCTLKSEEYFNRMELDVLENSNAIVTSSIHQKHFFARKIEASVHTPKFFTFRQIYHPWNSFDVRDQR